jgi:hypothetical protein
MEIEVGQVRVDAGGRRIRIVAGGQVLRWLVKYPGGELYSELSAETILQLYPTVIEAA